MTTFIGHAVAGVSSCAATTTGNNNSVRQGGPTYTNITGATTTTGI
jgi:hypothetical protein